MSDFRRDLYNLKKLSSKYKKTPMDVVKFWQEAYRDNAKGEPDHTVNGEIATGRVLEAIWEDSDTEEDVIRDEAEGVLENNFIF